jgi:hypothetical protein
MPGIQGPETTVNRRGACRPESSPIPANITRQ